MLPSWPKRGSSTVRAPFADSANLAAVCWPCTIVITAAAIGLYRPEICIERRRLLINTSVAGLLAFPAVLLVSGSFHIGGCRDMPCSG